MWRWIAVFILVVAGAGAGILLRRAGSNQPRVEPREQPMAATNPVPSSRVVEATAAIPPPARPPKSVEDLKVGAVTLERAKGSSLVHAIGILRNDSPHQRFGVKLELELIGAAGNKIGAAKDYRSVLEPHQEWHFRALVLDSKAVAAKVSSIREDE